VSETTLARTTVIAAGRGDINAGGSVVARAIRQRTSARCTPTPVIAERATVSAIAHSPSTVLTNTGAATAVTL
jgi:hypothetical protein